MGLAQETGNDLERALFPTVSRCALEVCHLSVGGWGRGRHIDTMTVVCRDNKGSLPSAPNPKPYTQNLKPYPSTAAGKGVTAEQLDLISPQIPSKDASYRGYRGPLANRLGNPIGMNTQDLPNPGLLLRNSN